MTCGLGSTALRTPSVVLANTGVGGVCRVPQIVHLDGVQTDVILLTESENQAFTPPLTDKKPPPRSTAINEIGKAALRSLRAIPLVRQKVIPWLVREEIDQIPTAPILADMRRELRQLSKVRGHVLVGPWLSEVGFELLYWIPFLRWAVGEFKLDPSRLVAVSRGGVSSWYEGVARQYVDLFDLYSVEEYREANETRWEATGNQKQYEVGTFDRAIVGRVSERRGITIEATLHPLLMYRLLRFFWYEKAPVSLLQRHTRYEALAKRSEERRVGKECRL